MIYYRGLQSVGILVDANKDPIFTVLTWATVLNLNQIG